MYVANGSSSGSWIPADSHIAGYVAFDAATPAYVHSTTTSDTVINPTFTVASSKNFSGTSSPNARLVYTGAATVYGQVSFFASLQQASGTARQVQLVLYKNGVEVAGSRVIATVASGEWHVVAFNTIVQLAQNDYLEIFIKGDASHTTNFAGAQMAINCFPG